MGSFKLVALILSVSLACLFGLSRGDSSSEDECSALFAANGGISPYSIVIDGGSTGSRLHVFHFTSDGQQVERKGSFRANIPLSAFGPAPNERLEPKVVAAHILELFVEAAKVVPACFHNTTTARYEATAGMRLLTEDQQAQVYDALYDGLMASDEFVFRGMQRTDVETLSGSLEGYYGAVAANYLSGKIDTNLQMTGAAEGEQPIGALDMGGSSTQIVYLTNNNKNKQQPPDNGSHNCIAPPQDNSEEYPETCRNPQAPTPQQPQQMQGEDFFSTSYLSYGVDEFRERLWNTLIAERYQNTTSTSNTDPVCDTKVIEYPCGFKGHTLQYLDYTFVGTGDAAACQQQIQRLIPHPDQLTDNHLDHTGKTVGGIEHPTMLPGSKFFAMSLYFFTLDSLRALSSAHPEAHQALNEAWPTPSIAELNNALEGLCSRSWTDDIQYNNHHQFTRPAVLPHRCFESVYLVTLLKDGFGFHPESRDITFTFLVDGSEVEWSLGMALAFRQEKIQLLDQQEGETTATCSTSNQTQEVAATTNEVNSEITIPAAETRIPFASAVVAGSG